MPAPSRLYCRSCGGTVALTPSHAQRRTVVCPACCAVRGLEDLLEPGYLAARVPRPWARGLVEDYAAFLAAANLSVVGRRRLVRGAVSLGQRMGVELTGPGDLSERWLSGALAAGPERVIRGSLMRFLRSASHVPEASAEELWHQTVGAAIERVPREFRRAVSMYTDFRVRIHEEQRRRRLARVLSLKTIVTDVWSLSRFAEHLQRHHPAISGWASVIEADVVEYLLELDVNPNTRNVRRWDLHRFFAYALRHRLVAHNPVPAEPGREAPLNFQPLTHDEQRALVQRWAPLREPLESLIGCLVLLHGLSVSELQRLQLADVCSDGQRLRVSGRPVAVLLDTVTRRALAAYLQGRSPGANSHLIISAHSRFTTAPIPAKYLQTQLRAAGVTPRFLRMTCLSTIAQESGPRLLVDAFGLSPTQAERYQRFLVHRAERELVAARVPRQARGT